MSKYRLKINDYHAIKSADIRLDGITMLAGENGCGKSTIARWAYYLFRGLNEFETHADYDAYTGIRRILRDIRRAISSVNSMESRQLGAAIFHWERSSDPGSAVTESREKYSSIFRRFTDILEAYVTKGDGARQMETIQSMLGLEQEDKELLGDYLERLYNKLMTDFDTIVAESERKKMDRSRSDLMQAIRHFSIWKDIKATDLKLFEDELSLVSISEQDTRLPLSLKDVVYFNTQDIGERRDSYLENKIRMQSPDFEGLDSNGKLVETMIRRTIGGTASYDKDPDSLFGDDKILNYHRKDGLVIPLNQGATGVISISYIYRLLVNGWLNSNSLLIIDEPEAHLHPQWIVEFARILVFLNKRLGVKLLISSHNPDMVSALQSIAVREGVADNTRFYLAEKCGDGLSYEYRDLGTKIGEIFESFNIALSRIDQYGERQ